MSDLEPLRRAFTADADHTPAPESCPEPDRIWAAAHGELPAEGTHDIVAHTASCAACAEAWRLAREVGQAVTAASPAATAPSPVASRGRVLTMGDRFRRFGVPFAGLAAAAVLLLMVGMPRDRPTAPEYRAGEATAIRSLLPAGAPVERDHCLLRWSEVEGARYSVLVSDARLAVVAQAQDLAQPRFQVPPESLAQLDPGAELYWQVEAVLPDGRSHASKTFVTRLE